MIHRVPVVLVADLWPTIEKHVTAALDFHPFLTADDLRTLLLNGHAQLFIAVGEGRRVEGFAIMEVLTYPTRKVATVLAAGGENGFLGTAIHELLPILKQWGAEQGADAFAISGRPGWLKALQNEGGNAVKLVLWWTELGGGDLSIWRRKLEEPTADGGQRAMETGSAIPH